MTDDTYVGSDYKGYTLTRLIGKGRFASVYALRHSEMSDVGGLALKQYDTHPELAAKESEALRKLKHPNIIKLYHFEMDGYTPKFILEEADHSLRSEMAKLSLDQKLDRITQILTGLSYAHSQGFVHKDLKPDNLLLKDGVVKLTDWNQSKDLEAKVNDDVKLSNVKSVNLSVGGTPGYTAPEGAKDARSDVYSVGAILYEMLTGKVPLGRFKLPSQIANAPKWIDDVVDKALATEPADRYQTADAMLVDLLKKSKERVPLKPVTNWEEFWNADPVDFAFLGKQLLKLPWNIAKYSVKYTVGLPITLLGKVTADGMREHSGTPGEIGCLGVLGILAMYAAMAFGGYKGVNYYADHSLANELKTNRPTGRIVLFDPAAGRMSYAEAKDLGIDPAKVTTVAQKLEHLVDFAPSADGRHVYVLHRPGNRAALTLVDLEAGIAKLLAHDSSGTPDAPKNPLDDAKFVRPLVEGRTETPYLKSGDTWYAVKDGTLEALAVFPPALENATTNRSADGAFQAVVSDKTAQIERTSGFLSLFDKYKLGQTGENTRIVWTTPNKGVIPSGEGVPQYGVILPKTIGDLPAPVPEKTEPGWKPATKSLLQKLVAPEVNVPVEQPKPKNPADTFPGAPVEQPKEQGRTPDRNLPQEYSGQAPLKPKYIDLKEGK